MASARTEWITQLRGPKNLLDPRIPYAYLHELEIGQDGTPVDTATIFLTNRECPFRCTMCDLWQNTLDQTVPAGGIPEQISYALARLPAARSIKLYNAGSFFDPRAIPVADYSAIADLVSGFERVIVEAHPAFIGEACAQFARLLKGRLEVAIGLETAHPDVLERLNKRFTVADFQRAAGFLAEHEIDLRVFLLVRPPFMSEDEGVEWACRSLDMAFAAGASACCLIPTRAGNGAMEALAGMGQFTPPDLRSVEAAMEYGLELQRGRVFADLWDVERFYTCSCSPERAARLEQMNRLQTLVPSICCNDCRVSSR
jgi:radical SAM enzyme (TIGR01210 family)